MKNRILYHLISASFKLSQFKKNEWLVTKTIAQRAQHFKINMPSKGKLCYICKIRNTTNL
jgi:hypothetical protein